VVDFALEQIGDGGEADVGMGPYIDPVPGGEIGGPHVIEEDEGADHAVCGKGQHPPHLEPAEVLLPRGDDEFDHGRRVLP
jgi:hypothetical protein